MKNYITLLIIVSLFTFHTVGAKSKAAEKTNVVLILIDDLSHYGVSAYGATTIGSMNDKFEETPVSTPRIDELAEQGLLFGHAYAYPLCEATRIALMSGQTNNRNYLRCKSQHASDITFGDAFQKAGYATGITGKWKQTRGTKEVSGKDYIFEFGWDEFCCFDVTDEGQRFINPKLVINGEMADYKGRTDLDPSTGRRWYGPDICNKFALDFIDDHKDEPFFLYYPMLLVHDDHKPTPDTKPNSIFDTFDEHPNNRDGHYGDDHRYIPDMIQYTDKLIGKVIDKLDALALRENTLVIVMGDNGTKESFYHGFSDGTRYPGRKGGNADNGLHVPLIISQPGIVPSGKGEIRRYDALTNLTDIYPTIAEAAGVEIPNAKEIDGISFWPQALGEDDQEHRDVIYTWYNGNNLYTNSETIIEYAFNKDFKLYAPSKDFPEGRFFDLRTDLLERYGDRHVELRFHVLQYSGIKIVDLTAEQKAAYDDLSQVLAQNQMTPVKALVIDKNKDNLKVNESVHLTCNIVPNYATRKNTIWESSDPSIASINKFGILTAHKPGEVRVSVYSWDDAFPQASNSEQTFVKTGISDHITIQIQ